MKPLASLEELTPERLTDILRSEGHLAAGQVESIDVTSSTPIITSTIAFLDVKEQRVVACIALAAQSAGPALDATMIDVKRLGSGKMNLLRFAESRAYAVAPKD